MGAFELQDTMVMPEASCSSGDYRRVKDECIVAYKVYDSCRRQNCLTAREIGPARAAKEVVIDEHTIPEGGVIVPPVNATSVTMDSVNIRSIQIVDKQPNPFRAGFWDIDIKYDIGYNVNFRDANGKPGKPIEAMNVFSMKATMFGSIGSDLAVVTDMMKEDTSETKSKTMSSAAPFAWVEAKTLGLDARIFRHHGNNEVHVTIGLFSILKLFRLVHLNVQSKGFCIPDECQDKGNINPCEYLNA
ncbi:MAG: hypothetical protein FWC89_10690 [Defluviitaleaceae bacterium]|nr:hypothetical protein [Defluviitaleaceae bacterium]